MTSKYNLKEDLSNLLMTSKHNFLKIFYVKKN